MFGPASTTVWPSYPSSRCTRRRWAFDRRARLLTRVRVVIGWLRHHGRGDEVCRPAPCFAERRPSRIARARDGLWKCERNNQYFCSRCSFSLPLTRLRQRKQYRHHRRTVLRAQGRSADQVGGNDLSNMWHRLILSVHDEFTRATHFGRFVPTETNCTRFSGVDASVDALVVVPPNKTTRVIANSSSKGSQCALLHLSCLGLIGPLRPI